MSETGTPAPEVFSNNLTGGNAGDTYYAGGGGGLQTNGQGAFGMFNNHNTGGDAFIYMGSGGRAPTEDIGNDLPIFTNGSYSPWPKSGDGGFGGGGAASAHEGGGGGGIRGGNVIQVAGRGNLSDGGEGGYSYSIAPDKRFGTPEDGQVSTHGSIIIKSVGNEFGSQLG